MTRTYGGVKNASSSYHRLAQIVADVFAPTVFATIIPIMVGALGDTSHLRGAGWGILIAVFAGVIPGAAIAWGVRRGELTDRHVRLQSQRFVPLMVSLASVTIGLIFAVVGEAPRDLVLLAVMMIGLAICIAVINHWWKVSAHTGMASASSVALTVLFGGPAIAMWAVVALIGWSRVRLRVHSAMQVVGGSVLGAALGAMVFVYIR